MNRSTVGLPLLTLGLAVAWQTLQLKTAARRSRRVASATIPFESRRGDAPARVLVLGDSTGVGVGAGAPSSSLPGLLGREFPDVDIVNDCCNGARVADALTQLRARAEAGERYDLLLLFVGGNDVLRLTPWRRLQRDAAELLRQAAPHASRIVWMGSANIGGAPMLSGPLAWWLGWRTGRVMQALRRLALDHGAHFIDFYRPRRLDLFAHWPELYFADDGLHPSAASYRHCYEVLRRQVPLRSLFAAANASRRAAADELQRVGGECFRSSELGASRPASSATPTPSRDTSSPPSHAVTEASATPA
jgi:lysophospholipase L1-like esterase